MYVYSITHVSQHLLISDHIKVVYCPSLSCHKFDGSRMKCICNKIRLLMLPQTQVTSHNEKKNVCLNNVTGSKKLIMDDNHNLIWIPFALHLLSNKFEEENTKNYAVSRRKNKGFKENHLTFDSFCISVAKALLSSPSSPCCNSGRTYVIPRC